MGVRVPGAKPVKRPAPGAIRPARPSKARRGGGTRADRLLEWIETLVITSGPLAARPGEPPRRVVVPEFHRQIIRDLYRTDGDGRRIVRQAVSLPRRKGKTFLASALCLAALAGPEAIPRGLCVSASADRTMAGYIYDEMKAFILADEALSDRIIIRDFVKSLEDTQTGSVYRALSVDARKAHGLGAAFVIADETSQWLGRALWDNLVSGQGAVREPLAVAISTRSADPANLTEELVEYGRKVRVGIIVDPSFASCVLSAPLDADWTDATVHHAVNPAVAAGWLDPDDLRIACEQAQAIPAREATFRLLRLNSPIDADERWLHSADWDACGGPIDMEELRGKRCVAAIDLGGASDLCGIACYFPEDGALLAWGVLPGAEMAAREKSDRATYTEWSRRGFIIPTPGTRVVRKPWIAAKLRELAADFDIECVVYDRWGVGELTSQCEADGVTLPRLGPMGQGFRDFGPAVEAFETAVLSGDLRHGNNPLLRWCLSNVALETDPTGARKITKARSRGRIDPVVACIMAVVHAARQAAPASYEYTGMMLAG